MIQLITLPNDNDPAINIARAALTAIADNPANGWLFEGYSDEADHLLKIGNHASGEPIHILDFVCHGSPTQFDGTDLATVDSFGNNLAQLPGFSADTSIILDGCNTGLMNEDGESIAQRLADATGCKVFGAKGFMRGTFAENNEECTASESGSIPFPGAENAFNRDVWVAFVPNLIAFDTLLTNNFMARSINIGTADKLAANNDDNREQALTDLLESILQQPLAEFPVLRMAPDISINYARGDENIILDVFANGSLVKERISGRAWKVKDAEGLKTIIRRFQA